MNANLTITKLAKLLREAEKMHAKYEENIGRPDSNWPEWYAEYILKVLKKSSKKNN